MRTKRKKRRPLNITGILAISKKGFGFVVPENGNMKDVFIPKGSLNGAMHGDTVEARVNSESGMGGSTEGEIIRILKRSNDEITGTFEKNRKIGFVVPDNRRIQEEIFVPKNGCKGARKGDRVVVKITKYPDAGNGAEGAITEIISRAGEVGGDIKALIRQHGLTEDFPSKVKSAAKTAAKKPIDMGGREDLRGRTVFTIDGADAKDLDDAVSIEKKENGNYVLGVHIADVSSYVAEDSTLDKEAQKRGNSVYLIDQVVPMLPKELSNGICSLGKGEDRMTLSIDMEITPKGDVAGHRIYKSLICSRERMVYTDVSDMLEHRDSSLIKKYGGIYDEIVLMGELAAVLKKKRDERGSIDFDLDEANISLDSGGRAESVRVAERRSANMMIEEFMLTANETVAEHFFMLDTPFVYRTHEKPSLEKMVEFKEFIKNFGLKLKGRPENVHPRSLNELLKQTEGKAYENVVNTVMLRSMKKAAYSTGCEGHFGLSLKYYCHFTSPIRRYPDLIIHRIMKEALAGQLADKRVTLLNKKTAEAAETSSATERKAIEMEREAEKMKKAEYMSDHIGEAFEGVISGVTSYGLYVELPNTVEGMVRVDSISGDYYDYEPGKYRIVGRHRNKVFALGDRVKVVVKAADVSERRIDFAIYSEAERRIAQGRFKSGNSI